MLEAVLSDLAPQLIIPRDSDKIVSFNFPTERQSNYTIDAQSGAAVLSVDSKGNITFDGTTLTYEPERRLMIKDSGTHRETAKPVYSIQCYFNVNFQTTPYWVSDNVAITNWVGTVNSFLASLRPKLPMVPDDHAA